MSDYTNIWADRLDDLIKVLDDSWSLFDEDELPSSTYRAVSPFFSFEMLESMRNNFLEQLKRDRDAFLLSQQSQCDECNDPAMQSSPADDEDELAHFSEEEE